MPQGHGAAAQFIAGLRRPGLGRELAGPQHHGLGAVHRQTQGVTAPGQRQIESERTRPAQHPQLEERHAQQHEGDRFNDQGDGVAGRRIIQPGAYAPFQQTDDASRACGRFLDDGLGRQGLRLLRADMELQRLGVLDRQGGPGLDLTGQLSAASRLHGLIGADHGRLERQQQKQSGRQGDQRARPNRAKDEQQESRQAVDIENVPRKQQDGGVEHAQRQQGHTAPEVDVGRLDRPAPVFAAQGDQQHPRPEQQGEQASHRALHEQVLDDPRRPVGIGQGRRQLRMILPPESAHHHDVDQQDAAQGEPAQEIQALQTLIGRH